MENFSFVEAGCASCFTELGTVYHLWTPENFQLIFTCDEDFKYGMSIFGLCAGMFPDVVILTFELMSNHLHVTAAGRKDRILELFELIKCMLKRYCSARGYLIDWTLFKALTRPLLELDDVRNVIAYDNRNGFVVCPDETPFSYRWGANRYYFNPDAKCRASENSSGMTIRDKRMFSHSHIFDGVMGLKMLDGYVIPSSFCRIDLGEKLFRNASHYFNKISRSIESYRKISEEIGESIFYTDDELYSVACRICREKYGSGIPSLIPATAKIELARTLHYEYNAQEKALQRMLKLGPGVINSLYK